jgi:hypothetical protein
VSGPCRPLVNGEAHFWADTVHHGLHFSDGSPYLCLGFRFDDKLVYLSDVSHIPENIWALLKGPQRLYPADANGESISLSASASTIASQEPKAAPDVLIIDCLRLVPHASHFGVAQAISTALRLKPKRTYLTGFAHKVTHASWHRFGLALSSGERCRAPRSPSAKGLLEPDMGAMAFEAQGQPVCDESDPDAFTQIALREVEGYEGGPVPKIWVRPAYDGLSICMRDGALRDQDD